MGTLIVPKWSSFPFWALIFEDDLEYKSYVTDVLRVHRNRKNIRIGNERKFYIRKRGFQRKIASD